MKIIVNDCSGYNPETNTVGGKPKGIYELEKDTTDVVNAITKNKPKYYYALINGKVFKADGKQGLKGIFFNNEKKLEEELKNALYWHSNIVPNIGCNCGYDTEDFYKKLCEETKIEIKQLSL